MSGGLAPDVLRPCGALGQASESGVDGLAAGGWDGTNTLLRIVLARGRWRESVRFLAVRGLL